MELFTPCAMMAAQGVAATVQPERSGGPRDMGWTAIRTAGLPTVAAQLQAGSAPPRDLVQYLANAGQLPRVIARKPPKRIGL